MRSACRLLVRSSGRRFASTDAATASGIPKAYVSAASAAHLTWVDVNVTGRSRLQAVANTCDGKTNWRTIRNGMKAPASGSVTTLKDGMSKAKTTQELAQAIENALFQVRKLEQERYDLQLHLWGLKDLINLGLNVNTADKIEAFKKDKTETEKKLADNRAAHKAYCSKTFDTNSFNDAINVFRIAGERCPHARAYAELLLDDMTLCNVEFNEATKMMLKNVIFGDQPHEDSNLLFSFVENPERGEVSLHPTKNGDLTQIADEAVITIGRRHTTPVTEHAKLQQQDTHPMLQRSPE